MESKYLLYFVKYPEPGKVKTRLAKTLGDDAACQAYRDLAESNFRILASLDQEGIKSVIVFDPPDKEREIKEWLPATQYVPQQGKDLGERLAAAFERAFDGESKSALALGSDTLGLKRGILREAFDALKDYDVALGPAKDGGYYLIGLSSPQPSLFKDIPWSTPGVYQSTIQYLEREQLSYYRLPLLEDLDDPTTYLSACKADSVSGGKIGGGMKFKI